MQFNIQTLTIALASMAYANALPINMKMGTITRRSEFNDAAAFKLNKRYWGRKMMMMDVMKAHKK